jgi:hypothetical protein
MGQQSFYLALDPTLKGEALARSAIEGLNHIDCLGLTEAMPQAIQSFATRLDILPPQDAPHARFSGAGAHPMSLELRGILSEWLEHEMMFYEAARKRAAQLP